MDIIFYTKIYFQNNLPEEIKWVFQNLYIIAYLIFKGTHSILKKLTKISHYFTQRESWLIDLLFGVLGWPKQIELFPLEETHKSIVDHSFRAYTY